MPNLYRFWPGFAVLVLLVLVPMLAGLAYGAWIARHGPVLGAADGIALIVICCVALYALGRLLRRMLRREPLTDVQFLVPVAIFAALSFDRVMASASPVLTGVFQLLLAMSVWLGARGSRSSAMEVPALPAHVPAGPTVPPPAAPRRRD